jgi:hypothetical protein
MMNKRKALFDYPNQAYFVYDDSWLITTDVSNLVGTVVMDSWDVFT